MDEAHPSEIDCQQKLLLLVVGKFKKLSRVSSEHKEHVTYVYLPSH